MSVFVQNAWKIAAASTTTAVTTGSEITIPDNAAGIRPKLVRMTCRGSDGVGFRPIQSGETPALSTMARLYTGQSIILDVTGYVAIRAIQITASCNVTVTPLENEGGDE